MTHGSYGQFCPVAMTAEMLCTRWTMLVIREMVAGSSRFGDLRRGVPRMSPTLLSQRLKDLEAAGIVSRISVPGQEGVFEYHLTEAGLELRGVVEAFGLWGQKWIETRASLENLDPALLMWDVRRNLDPTPLPAKRTVVQFRYPELAAGKRDWWLIVEPLAEVDLCYSDPGFEVDLWITTDLRTMTAIWMGLVRISDVRSKITFDGNSAIARSMQRWLGLSPFAAQPKLAG